VANAAIRTDNPALTCPQRIALYRTIFASRRIDDREIIGKRQNKVFFQINGAGHEAVQAASAPGYCTSVGVEMA